MKSEVAELEKGRLGKFVCLAMALAHEVSNGSGLQNGKPEMHGVFSVAGET